VRALTWNLFHGRSVPPAGRSLEREFAQLLAGWEWEVALLQEVPPWWPAPLARAACARQRSALTSRNVLLGVRRAIAERRPDLIKSNGGGCNAILARRPIVAQRAVRLRTLPERRVLQLVRLADGTCVANYHASTRAALAADELARLWEHALAWAGRDPLLAGGDLNLREPRAPAGFRRVARRDVDHLFARGLDPQAEALTLARGVRLDGAPVELSDHPPLAVSLRR